MKIGTFKGIGVYIHWTFWLLMAVYLVMVSAQAGLAAGLVAVAFIMAIFACVLLHEFGHAAAAAAFGISTTDITLLPIGGVARLERMPKLPKQELLIALAGPAVNLAIAAVLLVPVGLGLQLGGSAAFMGGSDVLNQLLFANMVLVVFNMLPAFPMDGGRVLRSLLAMRKGHLRATQIAARIGRWMALLFAVYGLWNGYPMLLLVAAFIFMAGTAELLAAKVQAANVSNAVEPFANWSGRVWPTGENNRYASAADPLDTSFVNRGRSSRSHDVVDAIHVRQIR